MGDPRPATPAVQVFAGDFWKVETGRFVSPLIAFTFSSSDCSTGKSFNRLPTKEEWNRSQKYVWGIRVLASGRRQGPDIFKCSLVLQLRIDDEQLLPRLETFTCVDATRGFTPFIPLFLS